MDILNVSQAAQESGLSISAIRLFCQQGVISANKLGINWYMTREEFLRFMQKRQQSKKPKGAEHENIGV